MMWERRGFGDRGGRGGFGSERPRFSREKDNEPKPVKEGDVQTVTISDISRRGDGIARVKSFVIFVPGTQKGDVVKIRIKEVSGNHATGEIVGEETESTESAETTDEVVESTEGPKNNGEEGEASEEKPEEGEKEEEDEEEEFA